MTKFTLKLMTFVLALVVGLNASAQDLCKPSGWATQNGGVTGGGSATPTVVSTYDALKNALASKTIKVIHIQGTITFPSNGRLTIQDKTGFTIIGLPGAKLISVDLTASGSGIFYMKRCSDLIMRNIIFEGPGAYDADGNDNLTVDACTNVWIDHCEFHDSMDGNLDLKNAADLISITWCTFSYEKKPIPKGPGGSDDHRYSNLIGSSDGATGDAGKLRITFQYCWWGEGCRERMPRVRYGKIHLVNNLFSSSVSNHCIRAAYKADILAEGNYFDNQKLPIDLYDGDYTGVKGINNYGASNVTKGTPFTPPYTLTVASPASIVSPIKSCAGAKLSSPTGCSSCSGTILNSFPTVSITTPTNGQTFTTVPATISLSAKAADSDGTISKVEFFNGNTSIGTGTGSNGTYTFSWTNVAAGSYSITAKATDNKGASTTSSVVQLTVAASTNKMPTVSLMSPTDGQTFTTAPTTVSLSANAADADGTISKVEFFNGNTSIGTGTGSNGTYTFSWTNVAAGTYSITAKATDNNGAITTSSVAQITVSSSAGSAATLTKRGSGSSTQTVDVGTPIVSFNYDWTNAANVVVTGFPAGIVIDINTTTQNVVISGSPSQTGTFPFTVTTEGGNPNATKSGTITVTGSLPNQLPVVSISSPSNNATFTSNTTISLVASSSDADGTITKVEFFDGTKSIGIADAFGTYSWTGVTAGTYTITAKATDNDGATTTSSAITIEVSNPVVKDCYGEINGTAYLDNCEACVGGTTGFEPCSGSLEAETVCQVDGIDLESTNSGFSGNGYVNTINVLKASAQWAINSISAKTVTLSFRFANGGSTERNANVILNGTQVGQLILAPTGGWSIWKVVSINLNVNSGTNKLILEANTEDGLANIDVISFSSGISAGNCVVTTLFTQESDNLEVYPNPTQSIIHLPKATTWMLFNTLGEKVAQGNSETVDLGNYSTGIYFLKSDAKTHKIIKE